MAHGHVLISGASIAGPALAYWLARYGFEVTVVERQREPRFGGYAIDVRGAAVEVADRIGLLPAIRTARTEIRGSEFVDARGRVKAGFAEEDLSGDLSAFELLRGDLFKVLYEATRDDVAYVFDDSIDAIQHTSDGAAVTFASGGQQRYDVVVGADGLHSNVRALAFGPEVQFRRFLGSYVSIYTVPNHLAMDRWALLHNVPGRLAGMYHTPRAEGVKVLFGLTADEESGYDRLEPEQQKEVLRTAFADDEWEVPTLLRGLEETPDFYFDSMSQIRMDHWSRGRVVLVGDAGYCPSPLSGQGTSLALVGAYVLAAELARPGVSHQEAFTAYEERIRGYVRANQKIAGSGQKILAPRTRAGIILRDTLIRAAPALSVLNRLGQRLQRASDGIDLPDPVDRVDTTR